MKSAIAQPRTAEQPAPVVALPKLGRELARACVLFALTATAFAWIFPAGGIWAGAFVCLTPWAAGVCLTHRAWVAHWLTFLMAWGAFLWSLRWLYPVTDMGYVALAFYLAIYWVLAGWGLRTARRYGISMIVSLPVLWVACEYLRAWMLSGFPWLFLAHALYERTALIQISDITGAYGVSFVAAAINGALAELAMYRFAEGESRNAMRQLLIGLVGVAVLVAATLGYGAVRMRSTDATAVSGPKVALVQEDFVLSAKNGAEPGEIIFARYLALAAAAAQQHPDIIVMPETPWGSIQNIEFVAGDRGGFSANCHEATAAFARGDYRTVNVILAKMERQLWMKMKSRDRTAPLPPLLPLPYSRGPSVYVLVGAVAQIQTVAVEPPMERFNSAFVYEPDGQQRRERYDKIHLVPFGEQVPFRYTPGLRWLYRWLNALSPFSGGGKYEYSLTSGSEFRVFTLPLAERTLRFGVPICYEDVMPYISRHFVWDGPTRRADFLVNISNDGWFDHSDELTQHLASCVFRAVENRVSIARAVNTGISALIDGDGRILTKVTRDGVSQGPGVIGYAVVEIPLEKRTSFYGRLGDLFAQICLALSGAVWLQGIVTRWVRALRNRLRAWRRARGARAKGANA